MITLKNITKTYGGAAQVQALKGINLTITGTRADGTTVPVFTDGDWAQ